MLKISHAFDAGAIEPIACDRPDDIRVNIRADSHADVAGPPRSGGEGSADFPDETVGWNGERSACLGAAALEPLLAVLPDL